MAERLNAPVLKTGGGRHLVGSNPPPSVGRHRRRRSHAGEAMDLREMLDAVLASKSGHAPRLAKSAAIVCEALRREGLEATVVGGAAIELHAPDAYATHDLDLVVSGRFSIDWNAVQARTFQALGFTRSARHWVRDDLYVEIP